MQIQQSISLKQYNTFGIDVLAKEFAMFADMQALDSLLPENGPLLILGGGSNVLFTSNFAGRVLVNNLKGIAVDSEDNESVIMKVGAGENWHQFVMHCVDKGLGGIENLSLIPGSVGASPMQNIGAYGVEIKDVFVELEAYHIYDRATVKFNMDECKFGYRESVFKRNYNGQFVITSVSYRLQKTPVLMLTYGAIMQELENMQVINPNIKHVSDAVIRIRQSKLPDPAKLGNAGSFFKNPIVPQETYEAISAGYPNVPAFHAGDKVKIPAGWLIEQCGWKGHRQGDAGCFPKQALVLVNYGTANGKEIFDLSQQILESVQKKFGVMLEREVNIY